MIASITDQFGYLFEEHSVRKLSLSKSSVSKRFSAHAKTKAVVFKFLWFKSVFENELISALLFYCDHVMFLVLFLPG